MATRDEFYTALQFMTRLPVPDNVEHSDDNFGRSARFYPAVGLVVGGIAALVYLVSNFFLPDSVSATLAVISAVITTGALHEDGLADAVDGLFGGRDRDHALEIMRDHQVGVYGILALVFAVILKMTLIAGAWDWSAVWAIVVAHVLSRYAIAEVIGRYDYARAESAKFARPEIQSEDLTYARLWAGAVVVGSVLLLGPLTTLAGVVLAAVFASGLAQMCVRKIGGYTGDCLGAVQQVAEIGFLLGALLWA